MKLRHLIVLALAAMLIIAGTLVVATQVQAQAAGNCLYGNCDPSGARGRLFGPALAMAM